MSIADQLRRSGKGRLSYEREASGQNLKLLLFNCSTTPSIHVSAKCLQNLSNQTQEGQSDTQGLGGTEKQDVEKTTKQSSEIEFRNKNASSKISVTQHRLSLNSEEQPDRPVSAGSGPVSAESGPVSASSGPVSGGSGPVSASRGPVSASSDVACVTSPEYGKSRMAIHKYEEELENETRRVRLQKKKEFTENKLKIERDALLMVEELEQKANFENLRKIQNVELQHEAQAEEIVKQHRMLRETHEQRKLRHDAQIQEAEHAKRKLKQEEIKRKEQERKQRQETLAKCVKDFAQLNAKIGQEFGACKYPAHVSEAAKKSLELMQALAAHLELIRAEASKASDIHWDHLEQCTSILGKATQAYELVKMELARAEVLGKEAEVEAEKQAKLKAEQEAAAASTAAAEAAAKKPVQETTPTTQSRGKKNPLCWDDEAFVQYTALLNKLKATTDANNVLSSTPALKKLKFDIQKAVNIPINAISDVSGDHLRDKMKRLLALLKGAEVEVTGRTVSVKSHAQLPMFCKYLIARMIVRKGEEQVSSKHETAFAIAMVAVGLWAEDKDLGELILAHFYAKCPYLVPLYQPRVEGQTDEDYFKSRGYIYEEGEVEKQDKFLKRMSGIMRLYFSILVSQPPRSNAEHPYPLQHAWTWFSRTLNLEPEPDITATMLYDFLQVLGFVCLEKYRDQFRKILHTVIKELMPKLKAISTPAGSGALARLQQLLEKVVKAQGLIPKPDGYLDKQFWYS